MRIRSTTVDGHQFTRTRRGYDAAEVDAVMARIAATLRDYETATGDLESRLAAAETAARVAKQRSLVAGEADTADASRRAEVAEHDAEAARRQADELLRTSQDEAAKREAEIGTLLEAARTEAETLRLETELARQEVEAQRAELAAERERFEAQAEIAEREAAETRAADDAHHRAAEEIRARAEADAYEIRARANEEASATRRATEKETAALREDAIAEIAEREAAETRAADDTHHRAAEEIRARAEADAYEIRARANEEASATRRATEKETAALREDAIAEITDLREATVREITELRSTADEHEQIVTQVAALRDAADREIEEARAAADQEFEQHRAAAQGDAADVREESLRQAEILLAAARGEAQRIRTEAFDDAAEIRALNQELTIDGLATRQPVEEAEPEADEEAQRTIAALADAEQARLALEARLASLRATVQAIEVQMRALAGDIADRAQKIGMITGTDSRPPTTHEAADTPMTTMSMSGIQAPGEHEPLATAEPSAVVVVEDDEADAGDHAESRTYTQHHAYAEPDGSGRPPADRATIVPPELAEGAAERDDYEGPYRTVYQRAGRNLRARLRQEGQDPTQRGR
jgi:DivIVA domain-containing protein